jgi:hypothetical protein
MFSLLVEKRMDKATSIWHAFIFPILSYFRKRRGKFLVALFPDIRDFSICDLGGSEHFWDKLDIGISRRKVTIYNISADETGPVDHTDSERCRFVLYDGHRVPTQGGAFDLCVSNSVIEHVPPEQREEFAREIMRIGRRMFVQTPAFEFPFEPHFLLPFLHWLPKWLGYPLACVSPWRLLARPSRATIRSYYFGTSLLSKKEIAKLFPNCKILSERYCFLIKSHYVVRDLLEDGLELKSGI